MFLATHGILSTTSDLYIPWSTDTYSFDYDGSLDYINVGNDTLLNFEKDDAFSVSCWFKCTSTGSTQTLISKVNSSNQGYYLVVASNGKLVTVLRDSNNDALVGFPAPTYDNNQWHHVLAQYDGSNSPSGISMFVDGVNLSLSTSGTSLSGSIQVSNPIQIGARNSGDLINGLIDEPAIFSQNLGSVNASSMYGSGSASDITHLSPVGWWRAENATFNGSNWTVSNAYKKGLNGTSVSMTSGSRVTDIPT